MTRLRVFLSRLAGSRHGTKVSAKVREELQTHLEMLTEENLRRGMQPPEARRQALLTIGNTARIEEACREQAGLPFFEILFQDLRYGARMFLKSRAVTAIALLTLALGIGINSAMFSIVNGVLLQPLPYRDPGRLVLVSSSAPSSGAQKFGSSPPDFRVLREKNHTLDGLSAFFRENVNLTGLEQPEELRAEVVSAEYFNTLGIKLLLGRTFVAGEESWGANRVVVLTEAFWRSHFNSDPAIAGKAVTIDGNKYEIIGVVPANLTATNAVTDLWLPMAFAPGDVFNSHNNYFINMVGRLKPGVTREQASADLNSLMAGIARQFPENKGIGALVEPLHAALVEGVRSALLMLLGVVGFVLLIACVNLANLLLARGAGRAKEIAIRSALGADRLRLVRQFLTESVLLALIGGAIGLGLADLSLRILPIARNVLPQAEHIHLDAWVLAFALGISLLTGVLFGLLPALHNARVRPNDALKEGGRTSDAGGKGQRLRSGLVIGEIALALVVLICSGLALRSFERLLHVDAGFDPTNVLTFSVNLPNAYVGPPDVRRIGPPPRVITFYDELLARINRLPGVRAAGATSNLPLQGETWGKFFVSLDRPVPPSIDKLDHAQFRSVAGEYFKALGIRLLRGRLFDERDQQNSPPVLVVNEALVRHFWPTEDPIGKTVMIEPPDNLVPAGVVPPGYHARKQTIVGVVADAHYGHLDKDPQPVAYGSPLQNDWSSGMFVVIRAESDPKALVAPIRRELTNLDKDLPMARILTMEEIMSNSVTQPRLQSILLGLFGALAMLLATVGIYGVMSYSVSQRTSEIGIRMALGASRSNVLSMVIRHGLKLAALGLAVGVALALAVTRVMAGLLFGISPTDPLTFLSILFLLTVVALLACYVPARRATRVDPVVALRYE